MWSAGWNLRAIGLVILIGGLSAIALGQTRTAVPSGLFDRMPSDVFPQVKALGQRVQTPGKEQTVFIGQFVTPGGSLGGATLVHQLPGLVQLQGFLPGTTVSFDGV